MHEIPTGFGGATGVLVKNNSAYVLDYNIEINSDSDNFYISRDTTQEGNYNLQLADIRPNTVGSFYIMHKPLLEASNGDETCSVHIDSVSSLGDSDDAIIIDVTGQRIQNPPVPDNVGSFYAIKTRYSSNFSLDFYWKFVTNNNYVTGFRLDLASDDTFSTVDSQFIEATYNESNTKMPSYGNYKGLKYIEHNKKIENLNLNSDYYARLVPINSLGNTGDAAYAIGFENIRDYILTDTVYSGLYPNPGDNLRFTASVLELEFNYDFYENLDLLDFIINGNEGSYNFSAYSGININFSPRNSEYLRIKTNKRDNIPLIKRKAPIYINKASLSDNALTFSSNPQNEFTITLNFKKTRVFGDPDYYSETDNNNGAVFAFDDLSYGNVKCIYKINKDSQTFFYAGWSSDQSYYDENNAVYIPQRSNLALDLRNVGDEEIVASSNRNPGKLIDSFSPKFSEIYLGSTSFSNYYLNNYDFLFRYDAEQDINNKGLSFAGTSSTNNWRDEEDTTSANDGKLANGTLHLVEAYGKKFYELDKGQFLYVDRNFTVVTNPSYCILVFALGRDVASNDPNDLRNDCNAIHKFIATTDSSNPTYQNLKNFQDNYAVFNAGTINNSIYGRSALFGGTMLGVNFKSYVFPTSINPNLEKNLKTSFENKRFIWKDTNESVDAGGPSFTIPNASYPINVHNISTLGDISYPYRNDGNKFAIIRGGAPQNLEVFELYFVEMLFGAEYTQGQYDGAYWQGAALALPTPLYREIFHFRNKINGIQSYQGMYDAGPPLPIRSSYSSAEFYGLNFLFSDTYRLVLRNTSSNTRLFLMDYLFSDSPRIINNEVRNAQSSAVVNYLANKWSPLIYKASNGLQIAGTINSSNKSINFPTNFSHPFINTWGRGTA